MANMAIDDEDWNFFDDDGDKVIENCFKGVLNQNNYLMSEEFWQLIQNACGANFEWPTNAAFGNAFKYLWQQYADNCKTNLKTHAERRLKTFFKMCVYECNDRIFRQNIPNATLFDEIDVQNAVNFTYEHKDTTGSDVGREVKLGVLLDELRACTFRILLKMIGSNHCVCGWKFNGLLNTFTLHTPTYTIVGTCTKNIHCMCSGQLMMVQP